MLLLPAFMTFTVAQRIRPCTACYSDAYLLFYLRAVTQDTVVLQAKVESDGNA